MLFVKSAGRIFTSSESLFQYKYKGTPALSYFSSSAVIAESYLVQSAIKYSISPFSTRDIKAGEELTANYNLYTYPKTGIGLQTF